MATIKPNSYVLNVDIKQRMSNKTPRFVQFDEAQIVFKIYDGGKPFDLSGFTSAVVTHKTRSNQVISGYGTFEELNGQRVVVYDYMGSEMKELGNVETSLSIYNDTNDKVSIMPFNVQIVRDLSHEYTEKDTSVLQDLIAKTTDAISKAEYAEDQGDFAKEQGTFAEAQGNHAKTQGDYAQTQGTRAETLGNKAETQVGQAQDILDVAVPAYERVEEVYGNTVNLENQHAYDATKQYYKNNIVEFNGSSYQALQDTKGNQPPVNASNEYWSLLARKGADGTGTVVRHREEFISTEGQTTFTLKNTYDQFQNRIDVTVGNVPQFSPDNFTEATSTSIKLNEPLPAGVKVVVTYFSEAQPLKTDLETVVNNHTANLNDNNATISSLSTQLADTTQQQMALNRTLPIGKVQLPDDLPKALDFDIIHNSDGSFSHSFDFTPYQESELTYYVSRNSGLDANDGLTETTPVRYIRDIFAKLPNLTETKIKIVMLDHMSAYSTFVSTYITDLPSDKQVSIVSAHEKGTMIYWGNPNSFFTWTQDENVYYTSRTAVSEVYDYNVQNDDGTWKRMRECSSIEECKRTKHSYYYADGVIYVHTYDDRKPDDDVAVNLAQSNEIQFNISNTLYLENLHFYTKHSTVETIKSGLYLNGVQPTSKAVLNKVTGTGSSFNGIRVLRVGETYLFDCKAYLNGRDGFNYHGNGGEFVFEYNCLAYRNGGGEGNNNATTGHDAMVIYRVNPIGYECDGPLCVDINGCYSLVIGGKMYTSTRGGGPNKAAYYFTGDEARPAIAHVIASEGGGLRTNPIYKNTYSTVYIRNGFRSDQSIDLSVLTFS